MDSIFIIPVNAIKLQHPIVEELIGADRDPDQEWEGQSQR